MSELVTLDGTSLSIEDVVRVARGGVRVALHEAPRIRQRMEASCEFVAEAVDRQEPIYGVTTGFGGMAHIAIPREQAAELQTNMLWYHKTGAGRTLAVADVRAAMLLRANSLVRGVSGVRVAVVERLLEFLNAGATPQVHEHGSIGASGDLVPLAYIAGAITGLDDSFLVDFDGETIGARAAMQRLGLEPISLRAKEGLALMNGTSVMSGVAANVVYDVERLLCVAMHAHALFIQALRGTNQSFHPFIHTHKPHPGQRWVAAHMFDLLAGSRLSLDQVHGRHQYRDRELIQDRYSLRCLPQFLGPIVDGIRHVRAQIEVELNSATDNPLIDVDNHAVYNGGNFLGQYVGMAMDHLRYYLGLLAKHLDVQIALLVAPEFNNGLPPSLVGNPARPVNMGLKGLQLSANSVMPLLGFYGNTLADRFPTHAEQFNQNINSQGLGSANLARRSTELLQQYLAMCLLFAVQGVDLRSFVRAGHYDARTMLAPATSATYQAVRELTDNPARADRPFLWNDDERVLDRDIRRIAEDLTSGGLLARAVADTAASLRGTDRPRAQQVPREFRSSQVNVAEHLERGARQHPDRTAVLFEGRAISYAELDRQANRTANALRALGITRGDRVALLLPNTPDFITGYLGIQKLGAIAVSVSPALKQPEVRFLLSDCAAKAVLVTSDLLANVPETSPDFAALEHRLVVDVEDGFQRLLAQVDDQATAELLAWNDPCAIVYSSGTTGFPKGATLSHGNVISNSRAKQRYLDIRPDDRLLLFMPLFHCFGQNAIMNASLCAGATLVLMRRFDTQRVLATIVEAGVTMFFGIPTTFAVLLERLESLGPIRYCFSAAASLPVELERRWRERFGLPLHQGYGLTETSPFASYNHHERYKLGSIGTPILGCDMKIVDVETGEDLGPGEPGEILIRGENVMLGYWQRPEETRAMIDADGWLHSGDIGRMDLEGYFYLVDRLKDMINVGGLKVYPAEVENILHQHPAVREVAVFGFEDAFLGEQVHANVVLAPGHTVEAEELQRFCRQRIANFKVPTVVRFVDELPKTRTGKVLKRMLRGDDSR
jgi:phenylalanine ammonia-lyase